MTTGWLCPKCGCGVAPTEVRCPCGIEAKKGEASPLAPLKGYALGPIPQPADAFWKQLYDRNVFLGADSNKSISGTQSLKSGPGVRWL